MLGVKAKLGSFNIDVTIVVTNFGFTFYLAPGDSFLIPAVRVWYINMVPAYSQHNDVVCRYEEFFDEICLILMCDVYAGVPGVV